MKEYLKKSLEYITCKTSCFDSSAPGTCTCGAEELINNIKQQIKNTPQKIDKKSEASLVQAIATAMAPSKYKIVDINMLPPVQLPDCNSSISIDRPASWNIYARFFTNFEFSNRDYLKPIYSELSLAFTNKPIDKNAIVKAIKAPDKR